MKLRILKPIGINGRHYAVGETADVSEPQMVRVLVRAKQAEEITEPARKRRSPETEHPEA